MSVQYDIDKCNMQGVDICVIFFFCNIAYWLDCNKNECGGLVIWVFYWKFLLGSKRANLYSAPFVSWSSISGQIDTFCQALKQMVLRPCVIDCIITQFIFKSDNLSVKSGSRSRSHLHTEVESRNGLESWCNFRWIHHRVYNNVSKQVQWLIPGHPVRLIRSR